MTVDVSWTLNVNTERPTNMHTYVYQTTTHVHTLTGTQSDEEHTDDDTQRYTGKKSEEVNKNKTKQRRNNITKQNEKECVRWGYNMKK